MAVLDARRPVLNEGVFAIEYLICTSPTTTEYATYKDAVTFYVIDNMENAGVRANAASAYQAGSPMQSKPASGISASGKRSLRGRPKKAP